MRTSVGSHALPLQKVNREDDLCLSSPPLTFFQSPFDRARVLADCVQVPVQRRHEQQAFREGDCVRAAKQLQGHKVGREKKKKKGGG